VKIFNNLFSKPTRPVCETAVEAYTGPSTAEIVAWELMVVIETIHSMLSCNGQRANSVDYESTNVSKKATQIIRHFMQNYRTCIET